MTTFRHISPADTAAFGGMRVLLVDDHPSIRSIITGILNALGISDVVTAERGDVALNHLAQGQFDLLITDFAMPGMSGIDLAKAVRSDARSAKPTTDFKIPILMITGNVTRERLNAARDCGVDEILAKPFTVLGVADRLNTIAKKRRKFVVCDAYVGPCRRRARKTDYAGPKRRDEDLVELPEFEVEQEQLLVREEARSLCRFAQSGDSLEFGLREAVIATALSAAQRAKRIREPLLERACMSLAKYVQWVSSSATVEAKIVETHGQAILELLELGSGDLRISEQVAQGLEDTVTRRITKRAA